MRPSTISDLREELQAVRGESRVKAKEEGIRNKFLQAAADEVFADHDWLFNRRSVAVTTLIAETITVEEVEVPTGRYEAPATFSMFNDYYIGTKDKGIVQYTKEQITVDQEGAKTYLTFPGAPQYDLVFHILAPDMLTDNESLLYFPQPILVAERAYVRLKTAYFPDEESDKEYARSRRALRELYKKSAPKQNFTTNRWG